MHGMTMLIEKVIALAVLTVAVLGCSQEQPFIPSKPVEQNGWTLEVSEFEGEDLVVSVTLRNVGETSRMAYSLHEFVVLDVQPDSPVKSTGHLVDPVMGADALVEVAPGSIIMGTFNLRNRLSAKDVPNGKYLCRITYDDSWVNDSTWLELPSPSAVGKIESQAFQIEVRSSKVVRAVF